MDIKNLIKKYEDLELLDVKWKRYIECGDGWLKLIADMLEELYQYKINSMPHLKVQCIKEKFGGLRVYLNLHDEGVGKIETKYVIEAERTCEKCGSTAEDVKMRTKGWILNLCDKCESERQSKRSS